MLQLARSRETTHYTGLGNHLRNTIIANDAVSFISLPMLPLATNKVIRTEQNGGLTPADDENRFTMPKCLSRHAKLCHLTGLLK